MGFAPPPFIDEFDPKNELQDHEFMNVSITLGLDLLDIQVILLRLRGLVRRLIYIYLD